MADDLSDVYAELRRLKERVRVLETANPLENSSISAGRLRIIGGTLRVDSGGHVEVDGTFAGEGGMNWSGTVAFQSVFTQNGPWNMNGAGTIAGDVKQTGDTTQQGNVNVTGGGKVTAGNVTVEPNKITVGSATLQNGELELSNGAKLAVGLTGGTSSIGLLPGGSADISANTLTAWLRATGATISVTTAQARISAPTIILDSLPTGAPSGAKEVLVDPANGRLYRAS